MNYRKIALLFCTMVVLSCAVACKAKDEQGLEVAEQQKQEQETLPKGDYVQYEGGIALSNVNAKQLEIKPTKKGAHAALSFTFGSSASGDNEVKTDGVPTYQAYMTNSPYRFVLEFANINNWDYAKQFAVQDDSLFYDVFYQTLNDSTIFRIVFQLKQDCNVTLREKDNQLTLNFERKAKDDTTTQDDIAYYVLSDELVAFTTAKVGYSDGYFPSLCNDLQNKVLISAPFTTEEEAQAFLNTSVEQKKLSAQKLYVIALGGKTLPAYSGISNLSEVYTQRVISIQDEASTLPVVIPDGMFLSMSQDGNLALFSKQSYDNSTDVYSETLWLMDSTGKLKPLSEIEFSSIALAQFSPDRKKLGLVEQTTDAAYLYVYDMETNAITNLGEEGLGAITGNFIWDSIGTALYSISGDETQKLKKYDFTIPDEKFRISNVEETEMTDGDLGYYNGELYFATITEQDEEKIFKIKPEGGLRREFADGGSFKLSPDGKTMAILSSFSADDTEQNAGNFSILRLKDMNTLAETVIREGSYVVSYAWSSDGILYYTQGKTQELNDEYSFALMRYDPVKNEHTPVCDLRSSDFFATTNPQVLYIPFIENEDGHIRATYELKVK